MSSDAALAADAGIPVDILRAIRAIESGGSTRAIRFEPHLFFRRVPEARSEIPFTPDPERGVSLVAGETNRAAFERARAINEDAAIESTSWGRYQVLGSHLLRTHPGNPVAAFDADPAGVSDELLVSWFESRPAAQRAAQAYDVAELARLYNGSVRWGERLAAALAEGSGEAAGATATWLPWLGVSGIAMVVIYQLTKLWGRR